MILNVDSDNEDMETDKEDEEEDHVIYTYYQEHLQLLIEDSIENMIQHLEKEQIIQNLKKELKLHIQRIEEIRKKYN